MLDSLANIKDFEIAINYYEWMDKADKGNYRNAFDRLQYFNTISQREYFPDESFCRPGFYVYKRFAKNQYGGIDQYLMHEKFLVSSYADGENNEYIRTEALHGSFNAPQLASKRNMESIMHFKQGNGDICNDLLTNWTFIMGECTHWNDLAR